MKNSSKQKRCGVPAEKGNWRRKERDSKMSSPDTAAGEFKFVSATLPLLEARLAAINGGFNSVNKTAAAGMEPSSGG